MHKDTVMYKHQLEVKNGKIVSVKPMSSKNLVIADSIIDGQGAYVIPGLAEMHYHWRNQERPIEDEFKMLIANGVTTVRNMAEYDWQDQVQIKHDLQNGDLLSPTYYTTGPYLQHNDLSSIEKVIGVVQHHKESGFDFIKIADELPKDIFLKLIEEAERVEIPVIGHAQRHLPLEYSLKMKSIEHVEEFVYLFSEEQRNDSEFLQESVRKIKESGLFVSPTLVIFEMITKYINQEEFSALKQHPDAQYMLPNDRTYWISDENPYRKNLMNRTVEGAPAPEKLLEWLEWMKLFTALLNENKVPLLTGSDTFGHVVPGFSIHRELELLVESGLTPYEALETATINPAIYLERKDIAGTIETGKNASFVLLNSNPLVDIRATKDISSVVINGEVSDLKALVSLLDEVLENTTNLSKD